MNGFGEKQQNNEEYTDIIGLDHLCKEWSIATVVLFGGTITHSKSFYSKPLLKLIPERIHLAHVFEPKSFH